MRITVYDSSLTKKAIYSYFVSLYWQTKYNDLGSFCLEFNADVDLLGAISIGDYISIDIDTAVMVVTSIEFTSSKIIVRGQTADFLLTTRVSVTVIKNENAELAMRRLVENMTPIPNLVLGELVGYTDKFPLQVSDKSVQEYCKTIARAADMGYRLRKVGDNLMFECYKPELNTNVKFSTTLGNLSDERYAESVVNFANVAIVAGQGSGEARITVTVGETESTGLGRTEIYVDARNVQQEDGESEEEYLERLRLFGEEKLAQHKKIQNTQFSIYGDDVSLGDMVYISPTYSKARLVARIVSMTIKCQNNKIQKTASVGTPIVA